MRRWMLEPNPAAPALARACVRDHIAGPPERVGIAELLVSELVTNAILHAHGDPALVIRPTRTGVRFEVADESPTVPVSRQRTEAGRHGGWGLQIVALLADGWGSRSTPTGKVVWFEIAGLRTQRARRRRALPPANRRGRSAKRNEQKADSSGV